MSALLPIRFAKDDADTLTAAEGRIAVMLPEEGRIGRLSRRLDRLSRGAIGRAMAGEGWARLKPGEGMDLAWPAGLKAEALHLVKLPRRAGVDDARKAGAAIGKAMGEGGVTVLAEGQQRLPVAHNLDPDTITALAIAPDGAVWLGTTAGAKVLQGGQWRTVSAADGLASNHVTHIAIAADGSVWVGTLGGVSWVIRP